MGQILGSMAIVAQLDAQEQVNAFSLRRWWVRVTVGEALGFAMPAAIWGTAWALDLAPLLLAGVVVVAGGAEGAVLGLSQALVLKDVLPGIGRRWVMATAAAAMAAWAMGMAPSTVAETGAPGWLVVTFVVLFAGPLLVSIGIGQWLVLRVCVPGSTAWIWWNVVAWLAGLPATFVAPMLVPDSSPGWVFGVAFGVGGLLMAAIMALVTGVGMGRVLEGQRRDV